MEITIDNHFLLVFVAFFAGLISSIAGSGGILTLPALLWAGLPPLNALATNKVQSSLGTLSSVWNFFRRGHLDIKPLRLSVALAVAGSVIGTLVVQSLDTALLTRLIPFLLLAIAMFFLLSPKVSAADHPQRISQRWFACTAALAMGFYGGFFGPGMGSIMPFLFVWLLGHNLVKATAETKLMILAVNGTSALIFVFSGYVIWSLAFTMSVAQVFGARLGSNLVIKRGSGFVQPIITGVTLLMALKLLLFP
ncbi:MAG: TSUP family transporter [Porticoccaceae bacterium]|nr:TSUP family transporter [Porticoccaceae bacterium]